MLNRLKKLQALFPGQQENERVCLITRPHWIVLAKKIAVWLVFVVLLVYLDSYFFETFPDMNQAPYVQLLALFRTVYLMFLVAALFLIWVLYYLNFQIVTNERIVDVTQISLLHHTTSELHLGRIQDVTADIRGFLGNFFDFGNVYVQTAGETARFVFDNVPNPHAVTKLILDLYEQLPPEKKLKPE